MAPNAPEAPCPGATHPPAPAHRPHRAGEVGPAGGPAPERAQPAGKRPPKAEGSSSAKYWVAGGAGLATLGAAAAFLFLSGDAPKDKVYVVEKGE